MKLHKNILCIAGLGILLGSTSLFAAEKTPKDIVNKAYAQIGSMDKYVFTALVLDSEPQEDGTVKQFRHDASVKVDRPGKLCVDTNVNKNVNVNNSYYKRPKPEAKAKARPSPGRYGRPYGGYGGGK